jgi:hypothetical protein
MEEFPEKNVIVARITMITIQTHAEPTASCLIVVMVFKTHVKLVTKDIVTPTSQTHAEPTACFHSVVMELLTTTGEKLVTMETTDLVMDAIQIVTRSAETVFSMQMRNAMRVSTTPILKRMSAEPTVNCSLAEMVSSTSLKSAITELPMETAPMHAVLHVPSLFVVMELLTH